MATFTVTTTHEHTFTEGWGVSINAIWSGGDEDGPEYVSDIDVAVVRITADTVEVIGEVPCVKLDPTSPNNRTWVPVANFKVEAARQYDDTHDLRDRWFATEEQAKHHANYTLQRWRNPRPWESFVAI